MVSVEASTGTGTARSWMTGRAQSRITGVVAAQAALETLAVPIPAGVRYVDDILSLGVLGSVLQELGCRFHDIASASEDLAPTVSNERCRAVSAPGPRLSCRAEKISAGRGRGLGSQCSFS